MEGGLPVKEELVVHERVVGAEFHDLEVSGGPGQQTQPRVRELLQHPPEDLVPHSPDIQSHSLVELPGLGDYEGVCHCLLLHCGGAEVGVGGVVVIILLEGYYLSIPSVEILHEVVIIILIACLWSSSILYIVSIL